MFVRTILQDYEQVHFVTQLLHTCPAHSLVYNGDYLQASFTEYEGLENDDYT
jgi:hypothetical protein